MPSSPAPARAPRAVSPSAWAACPSYLGRSGASSPAPQSSSRCTRPGSRPWPLALPSAAASKASGSPGPATLALSQPPDRWLAPPTAPQSTCRPSRPTRIRPTPWPRSTPKRRRPIARSGARSGPAAPTSPPATPTPPSKWPAAFSASAATAQAICPLAAAGFGRRLARVAQPARLTPATTVSSDDDATTAARKAIAGRVNSQMVHTVPVTHQAGRIMVESWRNDLPGTLGPDYDARVGHVGETLGAC